jgi:hypothetical protein
VEAQLLTERDVRELLAVKSETKNLDYKQSMNWASATAAEKGELIKDVLAMANTQDGGKVIFGVRDADFESIGLTEEEFQSFDPTRFADFLNRYANPSFACTIQKFTIDNKKLAVIEVPEFDTIPIICKADLNDTNNRQVLKRGALYIRSNRAASEIVPDAETLRDLLNRAVVKRGDELLKMVERLMKGKPIRVDEQSRAEIQDEITAANVFLLQNLPEGYNHAGHWEIDFSVVPYLRERVPNLAAISQLLSASQITLRGRSLPHLDARQTSNFARGVQSYMGNESVSGHLEGYRAYQSGVFVWRSVYWEDTVPSMQTGEKALSFVGVILDITEYFLFAKRYYEKLAPDATVSLTIRLTQTQDRVLKSYNDRDGMLFGRYVCRESQIEVLTECTVAELIASYDELARKAIRRVYELFNWNDSSEEMIRGWQERLVNRRL